MKCKVCGNTEFDEITVITGIDVETKGGINISLFNVGVDSDATVTTVRLKACTRCGVVYCNRWLEEV